MTAIFILNAELTKMHSFRLQTVFWQFCPLGRYYIFKKHTVILHLIQITEILARI